MSTSLSSTALPRTTVRTGALALVAALALSACGAAPDDSATAAGGGKSAATATSAADFGGMDKLVAAAKNEGKLQAIALPRDWANYGALIDGFQKKYGIKIVVENPDGSSQDEINAVTSRKGQDRAPDVLDLGSSFALSAAQQGLLAPYKVQAFADIPEGQKDPKGRWYNDYGGYISIGCDAKRVKECPKTFADLLKPKYKGQVALNGNPTKSGSAFGGVYAAALASGGSFDDIQPGLDFFSKLKKNGNYTPVESTPATVEKGETPISIDWDYLNAGYADQFKSKGVDWQVAVPADGQFSQFYSQAINKDAPNPATARLWQEYLYSAEGQNLWLKGYARPALMPAMEKAGTLDATAAAKLPKVSGTPTFPTEEQQNKAKTVLGQGWAKAVSG
ncbi:substrate-binding transporter [Streptomyces zinciresistens K42]|uniref:Substrate-binding transporter n=1 Tax=Streptomyces zinciresistens K42 TaxID=700597 RepID=G2G5A4_9ACTN|nr:extracellular solute-binding protein [Streptomyces zinciresistens]EGX61284.1 substrate-binding transporter [Streptomyces zinciresistens K42]